MSHCPLLEPRASPLASGAAPAAPPNVSAVDIGGGVLRRRAATRLIPVSRFFLSWLGTGASVAGSDERYAAVIEAGDVEGVCTGIEC